MHDRFKKTPAKARLPHRHEWLWEPLEADATFVLRPMFGAKAAYLDGKLMLCFCAGEEPWCGVLVCTDRAQHPDLLAEFPSLTPHPVLPKWLYLPETDDGFEPVATRLVALARRRDPRLGVLPQRKKSRQVPLPRPGSRSAGRPRKAKSRN